MKIEFRNICKSYGTTPVVRNVSFCVEAGELFFLLGPSGCGKTTLLRILAGFIASDSGDVFVDGQRVNDLPPEKRRMPMVFQNYALWPHLSVFENVAYGLRVRGLPGSEIHRQTLEVLEVTRMVDYQNRSPNQLSGGQQQRVAIARAMAVNPEVLLFDEPLSNLDARLRLEMREELVEIHRCRPFTAIYVTHDQEEAMTMATRIAVLHQSAVQQIGSPYEIYTRPESRFVAEFMGAMNWIPLRMKEIQGDGSLVMDTPFGLWKTPSAFIPVHDGTQRQEWLLGFRPSAVRLSESNKASQRTTDFDGKLSLISEIVQIQYAGSTQRFIVKPYDFSGNPSDLRFHVMEVNPRRTRETGDQVNIEIGTEDMIVLP